MATFGQLNLKKGDPIGFSPRSGEIYNSQIVGVRIPEKGGEGFIYLSPPVPDTHIVAFSDESIQPRVIRSPGGKELGDPIDARNLEKEASEVHTLFNGFSRVESR